MKKLYFILFSLLLTLSSFGQSSDLFISEIAEGSSNNKYLEIYNGTGADVDLSNYSLSNCNNGCDTVDQFDYPNTVTFDTGTILANGDVYIIAHPSANGDILAEADQTHTYLSNGDDAYALTLAGATADTYTIIDIVGNMAAEDVGTGWEVAGVSNATAEHTLVRKCSVTDGNTDWAASAGTNADDSEWIVYDQNTWDNLGSHVAECTNDPTMTIDSPSDGDVLPAGTTTVTISFSVENFPIGSPPDGHVHMSINGQMTGGPSGDGMLYTGDPVDITVADGNSYTITLELADETHNSLDPPIIASVSFSVAQPMGDPVNLFYSEYAEGSSNNKYFEIYNPTSEDVDLYYYAFATASNGSDGTHEYWNDFADGAVIPANSVYVVMHGSADASITAEADELRTLYHNGDDGQALVHGTEDDYVILDMIGDFGDDPGDGWEVAGVANATKDHTIVRKSSVCQGNSDFSASAGTNADDSEWIVYENNTWDDIGLHVEECAGLSISDQSISDTRIYPNPVNGNYITIQSPIIGDKYVEIFDINGRRVLEASINRNRLNVSSINSGFYMIKVTINGESKISKLVVR